MVITNNHVANSLPPAYLILTPTQDVERALNPLGVIHLRPDITDIDAFAVEIETDALGGWDDERGVCISESYQRACTRYPKVPQGDIQQLMHDLANDFHEDYLMIGDMFLRNYSKKGFTEETLTNAIYTSLASGNKAQAINGYYDANPQNLYTSAKAHINMIIQGNEDFQRAVATFGTGQTGNISNLSNLGEGSSQAHNFNPMA